MSRSDPDSRKIVVFDLDKTLTKNDTSLPFFRAVLQQRPQRILHCAWIPANITRLMVQGEGASALKIAFLAATASKLTRAQVKVVVDEFVDELLATGLLNDAVSALESHRRNGDRLVLASASLDLYVAEIASRLGFDHVVSTRTRWDGDVLSGSLLGPNLKGNEKLRAVLELFPALALRTRGVAYSDHLSDRPLLLAMKEAYIVNPSLKAKQVAQDLGFGVTNWR